MRPINKAGLDLIKSFEGLILHPYRDAANIPTIGYGSIVYENGKAVSMNDPSISEEYAEQLLLWQIDKKCTGVETDVKVLLNDNEYAALVSFAYNLGLSALHRSTLLRLLNANTDRKVVASQFLKWDRVDNVAISGLTRRRQAEYALFLQPTIINLIPDDSIVSQLESIENDILKPS